MPRRSISFLLPNLSVKPAGGYKVVFEYANRLAADGYQVNLIYPTYIFRYNSPAFLAPVRALKLWWTNRKDRKRYRPWFKFHPGVKECFVWDLSEKRIPRSDYVVATYIKTAVYLNGYRQLPDTHKFYLIQGYESWSDVSEESLKATYHFNMHKLVVSRWLQNILKECKVESTLLLNGFDFQYFHLSRPIEERDPFCISMMYHEHQLKGCQDGFKALAMVKEKYPQLHVNLFGVPEAPANLPDWYTYHRQPDRATHNELYNASSIFLATSWVEGWGLTVGEAMICGCAIVCTDILGYKEMVTDQESALLSAPKHPEQLAQNLITLLANDKQRQQLAHRGHEHIQQFTWESSYNTLQSLLHDAATNTAPSPNYKA